MDNFIKEQNGRVLITGGLGFIGSYLAEKLLDHGLEVVLLNVASQEDSVATNLGILDHPKLSIISESIFESSLLDSSDVFFLII